MLWSEITLRHRDRVRPGARDLVLHLSDQGEIVGAYSWDGPRSLVLIGHVEGQLFAGFLGTWTCGHGVDTVLVDLGSRSLHTSPGSRGASLFPSRRGRHPTSLPRRLLLPARALRVTRASGLAHPSRRTPSECQRRSSPCAQPSTPSSVRMCIQPREMSSGSATVRFGRHATIGAATESPFAHGQARVDGDLDRQAIVEPR